MLMNLKHHSAGQPPQPKWNALKWWLVALLLIGGIVANDYFGHVAWAIRMAVGIVLAIGLLLIALQTIQGRQAWGFIKGARTELRKVVWPTRQETVQTTLVVAAMVVVVALVLWGVDSLFLWMISELAGQRG